MAANKIVKGVLIAAGAGILVSGSAITVSTVVLTGNKDDNNFSITVSSDFEGHENYSLEYQKGVTAKTLKDVLKKQKGYKIEGLYKDKGLTQKFKDDEVIKEDTTVYVKYVPITYTVILHYNDENGNEVTEPVSVQYGYSVAYDNPASYATKRGTYTFNSWTDAHGNAFSLENIALEDDSIETIDVYAKYDEELIGYDFGYEFSSNGLAGRQGKIVVTRGGVELQPGDKIHYGDRLKITYVLGEGCKMTEFSVSGAEKQTIEGEEMYVVTLDDTDTVSVHYTEALSTFTLEGIPSQVTVERVTGENQYETLGENATIAYGDQLRITYIESKGKYKTTFGVDGVEPVGNTNGAIVAVTNKVTITYEEEYIDYVIVVPNGVTVTHNGVKKTSNFTAHYGDTLVIDYELLEGYEMTKFTVNGESFEKGGTYVLPTDSHAAQQTIEILFEQEEDTNSYDYLTFTFNEELGGYEVTGFDGSVTEVIIPARYKGKKVIGIQSVSWDTSGVFRNASITSVVIKEGVERIGDYAFNWSTLESIKIPSSVNYIGKYAFYVCSSLTSVEVPSNVKELSEHVFANCSNLSSITLNEGLISIGKWAFSACTGFTSITIPSSVTSIGLAAFERCKSLTSIEIPANVTSIEGHAFVSCTSLKTVIIGKGVTSIGNYAFYGCSNLTSVIFEITSGWKVGTTSIDVSDSTRNATYLSSTYYESDWKRS